MKIAENYPSALEFQRTHATWDTWEVQCESLQYFPQNSVFLTIGSHYIKFWESLLYFFLEFHIKMFLAF